jgi:hypothetical protein
MVGQKCAERWRLTKTRLSGVNFTGLSTHERAAMKKIVGVGLALTVLAVVSGSAREKTGAFDLAKVGDGKTWKVSNATVEPVEIDAKIAARLKAAGDSGRTGDVGLALASRAEFTLGTIELDLKGRNQRPSFLGVVFNVADERTFEGVYFRPFNFKADGPFRLRAVQYIAWPEHTWEELRKNHSGQFEKPANPAPDGDGWFHARIEVTEKLVRVFLNNATEPCLTVNRLAESRGKRPVGLFVDVADGLFANLEVKPAI